MNTFNDLQTLIIEWAKARQIIPNSTPQAQLFKTMEELGELCSAVARGRKSLASDAFGDVMVTLIIAAKLMDLDLVESLAYAYDEIKDRKGRMTPDGIFVKDGS